MFHRLKSALFLLQGSLLDILLGLGCQNDVLRENARVECLTPLVDEVSRDVVLGGSEGWLGELFLLHLLKEKSIIIQGSTLILIQLRVI